MKPYRNTAFLIELMVNVLVLSISCAVLVMVLVEAALTVRATGRKNAAGNEISSLLETARVRGIDAIGGEEENGARVLYYDQGWQPSGIEEATFVLSFTVEEEATEAGLLQHVSATAKTTDSGDICSFMTSLYLPDGELRGAEGGSEGSSGMEVGG